MHSFTVIQAGFLKESYNLDVPNLLLVLKLGANS
jgi:hypothetical protein